MLRRVNGVLYEVTTSRRRTHLVEKWERAAREHTSTRGALVHVAQLPCRVADVFREEASDRATRARAVLAVLGDDDAARARWSQLARASAAVKTVMRRLGPDTSAALLEHAYVLAMCNLLGVARLPAAGAARRRALRCLTAPATTA